MASKSLMNIAGLKTGQTRRPEPGVMLRTHTHANTWTPCPGEQRSTSRSKTWRPSHRMTFGRFGCAAPCCSRFGISPLSSSRASDARNAGPARFSAGSSRSNHAGQFRNNCDRFLCSFTRWQARGRVALQGRQRVWGCSCLRNGNRQGVA